jgi:hypothetical protein
MILKFLGSMDFLAGLIVVLSTYDFAHWRIVLLFSSYLIIKGVAWRGSFPSFMDLCIGVYAIMTIFFASSMISWLAFAYLGIKGLQSFFG